jgi:hypothetical protein
MFSCAKEELTKSPIDANKDNAIAEDTVNKVLVFIKN